MKTRFLAASALAAATLFFGGLCSPAQAADPYEIHVILSLSGPGAFLGNGERQALQFAESATNASGGIQGHKLTFVYHDDQTNPQVAVQLANDVLATKPAVILGSSLVATCRAMMPLMQNGPLMYCFSPGIHPDEGSYVFTASVSTFDLADSVIRYFRMKGWKRFGVIFSTDASGQDAEKGIDALLQKPENTEIEVVGREHFNTTDVSVCRSSSSFPPRNGWCATRRCCRHRSRQRTRSSTKRSRMAARSPTSPPSSAGSRPTSSSTR